MAWIEFHEQLRDHYKVHRFAKLLKVPYAQALGHLACLWTWAAGTARDGHLKRFTDDEIAYAARWEGQSNGFVTHLVEAELLDKDHSIHDWNQYGIKALESARKRQAKWRLKHD